MPLHAITNVHGEPGLRERLVIETASWPPADRTRVQAPLDLAARLHARDRRQREPYVNHLLRVCLRIISHYRLNGSLYEVVSVPTSPIWRVVTASSDSSESGSSRFRQCAGESAVMNWLSTMKTRSNRAASACRA